MVDSHDFVVANFHSLEEDLLECMEFIPYIEQNRSVVSPKFVPILMESCSLIDSIFRDSTDRTRRFTLKGYALECEPRLELEAATTILLASPLQLLQPFRNWTTKAPLWWDAHNRVKHDRVQNYHVATYELTITSLAALHQVLARSWQFLGNLTRAGWFNESSEDFTNLLAARAAGSGPPDMPVETRLFVSPIRSDFVDWNSDPPSVESWDFTERVKNHIWEWEGW